MFYLLEKLESWGVALTMKLSRLYEAENGCCSAVDDEIAQAQQKRPWYAWYTALPFSVLRRGKHKLRGLRPCAPDFDFWDFRHSCFRLQVLGVRYIFHYFKSSPSMSQYNIFESIFTI